MLFWLDVQARTVCRYGSSNSVWFDVASLSAKMRETLIVHSGKRYLPLDAVIWDFEGTAQESPVLLEIIRNNYIEAPGNISLRNDSAILPSRQLLKIFKNKKNGVAVECGATFDHTYTDWLMRKLGWRVLKIQPNPLDIEQVRATNAGAHTSHSCIPTENFASHTHIQTTVNFPNGTLTAVPCFPLYSMMKAFDATILDLLILNDVKAPIKVLQTLPTHRLTIRVISFVNHLTRADLGSENSDTCCAEKIKQLMRRWGYSSSSSCPSRTKTCYYVCDGPFCPNLLQSEDTGRALDKPWAGRLV